MDIINYIEPALSITGSIVMVASLMTAGTSTPDPQTTLGRVYRAVEVLALVSSKAKDRGPQV